MSLENKIKDAILVVLPNAQIEIFNPSQDGLHFETIVIDKAFEGKTLIEQQRLIMEPLNVLFKTSIHAMSLKTYTPKRWEEKQQ